tara:strand:+ start:9 stop:188 length:180 start_codon:yes stop_codon:yes gene_type:complete
MDKERTEAMLSDILEMLDEQEKRDAISGPMAICLYHLTETIVHAHIHAANRNQPIPTSN